VRLKKPRKLKIEFLKEEKMPWKFESLLIKMAAVEALQDPFMHMHTSDSDEENFKTMDVSGINKLTFRQFKRHMKSCVSDHLSNLEKQEMPNQQCEVSQMLKKHPEFDPVFMKV